MRLLFNIQTNNSAIALNIGNISSLTMNVTTTCSGVITTFHMGNYFIVKFCDIVIFLFFKITHQNVLSGFKHTDVIIFILLVFVSKLNNR